MCSLLGEETNQLACRITPKTAGGEELFNGSSYVQVQFIKVDARSTRWGRSWTMGNTDDCLFRLYAEAVSGAQDLAVATTRADPF